MSKDIQFDERKESLITELRPATDCSSRYIVSEFKQPGVVNEASGESLGCDAKPAASLYISKGYFPIPVENLSKKPVGNKWQCKRLVEADIDAEFQGNKNIGLILGEPSGGLTDVDLDCEAAVRAGSMLLPKTGMVHSRGSMDSKHFWYICKGDLRLRRFQFDRETFVEIRTGNGDSGCFTMVPPSVHPNSKLPLEWEGELKPLEIEYTDLEKRVEHVAAAALLAKYWGKGCRHDLAMAFSGFLANGGFVEADAARIVQAICVAADDLEHEDRLLAVKTTYSRLGRGEAVTGASALLKFVDEEVLKKLSEWLHITRRAIVSTPLAKVSSLPTTGFECTDVGNSHRLVNKFQDGLRYAGEAWGWMVWDGKRWALDTSNRVQEMAKEIACSIQDEVGPGCGRNRNSDLEKWANNSQAAARIGAMIELASSDPKITSYPENFDKLLEYFNVLNGTLELRTGVLRGHSPGDMLTKMAQVSYLPGATCPTFLQFLDRIFGGDKDLVQYVQKIFGYSLLGGNREQVLVILFGNGANGKTS